MAVPHIRAEWVAKRPLQMLSCPDRSLFLRTSEGNSFSQAAAFGRETSNSLAASRSVAYWIVELLFVAFPVAVSAERDLSDALAR